MQASSGQADGPRILFVEDEPGIFEPFTKAMRRAGFQPIQVGTARAALEAVAAADPDLVLLDLMLPDGDGRDVAREIRTRSEVPIIMLTARGTEADRVIGLEIGADDYVVKPFSAAEVIARIRAVLRRTGGEDREALADAEVTIGPLTVALGARVATIDGTAIELTRKEFDLLALLVRRAGRVVPREEIMSQVWDENWFGSTKTLDVHVSSLRRKLGDDPSDPRFLHTVRGVGLRFAAPRDVAG